MGCGGEGTPALKIEFTNAMGMARVGQVVLRSLQGGKEGWHPLALDQQAPSQILVEVKVCLSQILLV